MKYLFPKGYTPWNKGKKLSEATRLKMRNRVPWNKGRDIRVEINCIVCDTPKKVHPSQFKFGTNSGKFCSSKCANIINKDKLHTPETYKKISDALIGKRQPWNTGDRHYGWKGGVTPLHKKIRNSFEYEEWRKQIFERDLYTCQHCGEVGGKLNADHIKPFALYPDLRLELSNGQTLCEGCHDIKTTADKSMYKFRKNQFDLTISQ